MPIYSYRCNCGNEFDHMQRMDDRLQAECPECNEQAKQMITPVRCKLDGTDPDFPGEYMKWERKRSQHMAQERKREQG